jgi:hypothetical protein
VTIILSIPRGQLIGSSIENALLILGGIYALWVWRQLLRRKVEFGKISKAEAQTKLKRFNPKWGYVFFAIAIIHVIMDLTV